MKAKGKVLLMICGVLNIIFGILTAIISIFMMIGGGALGAAGMADFGVKTAWTIGGLFIAYAVLSLVIGLLWVISGVVAVKNSGRITSVCLRWGIVLVLIEIISLVVAAVGGGFQVSNLLGLVFPVLYLVGGILNKPAAE